jgi:hypothetical protein
MTCLLILEFFCLTNSFFIDLKGASIDAGRFQDYAIEWARSGEIQFVVDAEFYIQFLGMIYRFTGPIEFFGSQFGIAAILLAGIYFEKLLLFLGVRRTTLWIAIFLLWPSLLTRTTTTMREPFMIMFLVVISYNMVLSVALSRTRNAIAAVFLSAVSALFHKSFAILFVTLVPYVLFFIMTSSASFYKSKVFYIRAVFIGLFVASGMIVATHFSDLRGLQPVLALAGGDTEFMQSVVDYKSSRDFRATYDASMDFSSPIAFTVSLLKAYIYYQFYPFPWMISNLYDAYASLEGLFRLVGFFLLYRVWRRQSNFHYNVNAIIIILLMVSTIWAAGTSNYGTASRHHTTTNWIFLLMYAVNVSSGRLNAYTSGEKTT